jgi:hypothetical protein
MKADSLRGAIHAGCCHMFARTARCDMDVRPAGRNKQAESSIPRRAGLQVDVHRAAALNKKGTPSVR